MSPDPSSRKVKRLSVLILFLPGLSFWNTSIGKDALTFMGAGLATWAALDIRRRTLAIAASVILFLIPRPHMAGILLFTFTLAMLLSSKIGLLKKLALLALTIPLSVVAVKFGIDYAGLDDPTNLDSIGDYFERRQADNDWGTTSIDISSMSMPTRMFTYLFRPLPFDVGGRSMLGIIVGIENIILMFIFMKAIFRIGHNRPSLGRFGISFLFLFSVISWLILANTSANLGISLRQKWMFLPMLFVLAFSYLHASSSGQIAKRRPRGTSIFTCFRDYGAPRVV